MARTAPAPTRLPSALRRRPRLGDHHAVVVDRVDLLNGDDSHPLIALDGSRPGYILRSLLNTLPSGLATWLVHANSSLPRAQYRQSVTLHAQRLPQER